MYPSLRLGYMVLPEPLVAQCVQIKEACGLITSSLPQFALANFINQGCLERHINKRKRLYNEKRKAIISILQGEFDNTVQISGDWTGLYLVAEFKNIIFTDQLIIRLLENKVRVYRVEDHSIRKGKP